MNKKPMIIVGLVFALIIIVLISYLVLNLTTDIFKPTNEVFNNYLKDNIEKINKVVDISKEQNYINTLKQNNYRDDTNINVKYKNTRGNIEDFDISSKGITNNSENNSYRSISIKYDKNYNIMNMEYLKENQTQGILFSDVVKQFISTDIEDLDEFLNIIGINIKDIKKTDIIEYYNLFVNEKDNIEKICANFISKMNNSKFGKKKNMKVTLNNGEEKNVNEYYVHLTSEDTKELYLEILKALNMQEKINEINANKVLFPKTEIILYISNNKTTMISVDVEDIQLKIEFNEDKTHIEYNNITENKMKNIDINIKKEETTSTINYRDSYNNNINIKYGIEENSSIKKTNVILDFYNDFISKIELELTQNLEISNTTINDIKKKFENQANINIEKLNTNDRNAALNSLMMKIDTLLVNVNNKINSQVIGMWLQLNNGLEDEYNGINEKHRKEFNNQFLSYGGQDVEKKIIYNLLDLCGRNAEQYDEVQENVFRIYISQDTKNVNLAEEIKEKIEKQDLSYNIEFGYNSEGKINIVEIKGYKKQK